MRSYYDPYYQILFSQLDNLPDTFVFVQFSLVGFSKKKHTNQNRDTNENGTQMKLSPFFDQRFSLHEFVHNLTPHILIELSFTKKFLVTERKRK